MQLAKFGAARDVVVHGFVDEGVIVHGILYLLATAVGKAKPIPQGLKPDGYLPVTFVGPKGPTPVARLASRRLSGRLVSWKDLCLEEQDLLCGGLGLDGVVGKSQARFV